MIKTLRVTAAAVLASFVGMGVAAAQSNALSSNKSPVSNPSDLLPSLHAEAIIPVLSEMGIQYQGATLPNGEKVILAQAPDGIKFQLTPTACDANNRRCRGLSMVALFESTQSAQRAISAFDQHYVFVSAGMNDSGVAYLTRYDIADYGVPRGNLAISLLNYLHMAAVFDRHLYEADNMVFAPTNSDLSAERLNMQSILANSSLAQSIGISRESHQVSFEKLTDVVDTFVEADALAPGRLINQTRNKR